MANPAQQPKVLRIGIIIDGKIVQERLVKAGETVTVGDSPKNSFQIPKVTLPRQDWPLFIAKGNKYFLHFTESMKGKVGSGGAVVGLEKIRTDPSVEKDGSAWRLPLSEQDRGKVQLDNVTVLFQFVSPPPVTNVRPPRTDFTPRLVEEEDGLLFGFLVLFSVLAAIFILWARFWVEDAEEVVSLDQLDEKWTKLLIEKPPEPPPTQVAPTEAGDKPEKEVEKPKPEAEEKPTKDPGEPPKSKSERTEAAKDSVMKKSVMLQYLVTRGDSSSGSAKDLWSEQGDIAAVAGSLDGVTGAKAASDGDVGKIRNGGGGGPGGDATLEGGIGVAGGDGGNVKVAAAPAIQVDVGVGEGSSDDMEPTDQATVKKTVQRYSGQLKYCYESRLKANPDLAGRVEIEWTITAGRVTSAEVFANTTGDSELASCIVGKVKRWTFPTELPGGEVLWPFIFKQKT